MDITKDDYLIFDLDGTIADTEKYHWMAHNKVVGEYGITLTDDDIKRYIGHNDFEIYDMISKDFCMRFDVEKAIEAKVNNFIQLAKKHDIRPFDKIKKYINSVNNKMILTSQRMEIVNFLLNLWGMDKVFSDVISLAFSDKSKLDIIGEHVIDKLGIDKERIVVFEDSPRIIESLYANKIRCVAVINEYNQDVLGEKKWDLI